MLISDWSSDVCSSDLDQAVLTVTRIMVERNIGKNANIRHSILDRFGRPAHEVIRVQRFLPVRAALFRRRVGEEGEAGYARITRFPRARDDQVDGPARHARRSEEHTSELQSLMRISYAVFCLKKKTYTY